MHRFQRWRDALVLAGTPAAVVEVMQNYVRELPVEVEAMLPHDCLRALKQRPLDVQTAAVMCLQAELRYQGTPEQRAMLHEVAHTLAAASVRVTMVTSSGDTAP